METRGFTPSNEAVKSVETLPVNNLEEEFDNEIINLAEHAITRIRGLSKAVEETRTTPSEISQIKEFGGDIGNKTAEVDEQIKATQESAVERIEHIREGHELYGILSDPTKISGIDLQELQSQTGDLRTVQRKFNSSFGEVSKIKDKKEKVAQVDKMLETSPLQDLTAGQTATIFNTFKQVGNFEKMISVYNQTESMIFKKSPVIRELLAVALHKVGSLDESEAMIQGLIQEGKGNGEVYAILGKIHKVKHDRLQAEDPVQASIQMKESVDSLEKGFKNGFEFYPGINLVYNKITEGGNEKNVGKIEKALKTAELVYISTQKAGGMNSGDFWTLATLLESSLMTGRESVTALNKVIDKANVDWEINAPIENLERLKNQLDSLGNPEFDSTTRNIENALTKLKEKLREIKDGVTTEKETNPQGLETKDNRTEVTDYIFNNGFNYGEISSFVGGNIEYGGQLHAHVVNRWDIGVGREFLKKADLDSVTDFGEFNKKIDALIRERYGTAPLEDLHSEEHKDFDNFMKSFNGALSVEKQDDSRTNVMVDFWLGKGDCRQHAHTKQLFFDIWKTDNINKVLKESYDALESGDEQSFNNGLTKAKSLVNSQMFVFDSIVMAPIQMEQKYLPVEGENGKKLFTVDGAVNEVEDHTWNGLVELDDEGKVKSFTKTDSFYQNEYNFGGGVETNLDGVTKDGFSGGGYEVLDPVTNKMTTVEIKLVPTPYAGNRDKRMKSRTDDLGLPLLRGLTVEGFPASGNTMNVDSFFDRETNEGIKSLVSNVIKGGLVKEKTLQDNLV